MQTPEQAWKIVFAYTRRWDIEATWRESSSELGFECPRLRDWEHCRKLLLMVTLAYAFLLTLMQAKARPLRMWVLRHFCHRTGKKARQARLPLYRLRLALPPLMVGSPTTL